MLTNFFPIYRRSLTRSLWWRFWKHGSSCAVWQCGAKSCSVWKHGPSTVWTASSSWCIWCQTSRHWNFWYVVKGCFLLLFNASFILSNIFHLQVRQPQPQVISLDPIQPRHQPQDLDLEAPKHQHHLASPQRLPLGSQVPHQHSGPSLLEQVFFRPQLVPLAICLVLLK